jgi:hypothetical protein
VTDQRYFQCQGCGQVVQGWEASNWISCCEVQQYEEIAGPEEDEFFNPYEEEESVTDFVMGALELRYKRTGSYNGG